MKFDDTKLKEKLKKELSDDGEIPTIDLNRPEVLKKDHQIQIKIFQCPRGGRVSESIGSCRIAGKCNQ